LRSETNRNETTGAAPAEKMEKPEKK